VSGDVPLQLVMLMLQRAPDDGSKNTELLAFPPFRSGFKAFLVPSEVLLFSGCWLTFKNQPEDQFTFLWEN
jgi:hypothetical protein